MFHTISNFNTKKITPLLHYIDNRNSDVKVGLRSISYVVDVFNIKKGEFIRWQIGEEGAITAFDFQPGLYSREELEKYF